MWGAIHCYLALKAKGQADHNFLVMGPWRHSQVNNDGYNLGPLKWDGDTALQFRRDVLKPFFDQYLKTGAPKSDTPPVFIYNTGENHWERLKTWPLACDKDCAALLKPLYLQMGYALGFDKPAGATQGADSYVSDPAKPVRTFRAPFVLPMATAGAVAGHRPTRRGRPYRRVGYQTRALAAPVRISGAPIADLFASTTGTDADWVVKVIDVFPMKSPANRKWAATNWPYRWTFSGAAIARVSNTPQPFRRQAAALPLRSAHNQPRLSARPSHHGADPVELVPALRSQSADLHSEYLLREA